MGAATHGLVGLGPVRDQAGQHSQKHQDTGAPKALEASKSGLGRSRDSEQSVGYEERQTWKLEGSEEQPDVEVVCCHRRPW